MREKTRLTPVFSLLRGWLWDCSKIIVVLCALSFGFMQAATWHDARKALDKPPPVEETTPLMKATPATYCTDGEMSHRNPVLWI